MGPKTPKLPPDIVDCHHHFYEPSKNDFSKFLGSLGAPDYPPEKWPSGVEHEALPPRCEALLLRRALRGAASSTRVEE